MSFFCTYCHAALEPEHRYCAQCGQATYRRRSASLWIHLGWAAFCAFAVSGVGGAWWINTTTKATTKTVILKSAQKHIQTDVNAVQQSKPNQEMIEISAADLAPFRWKPILVDVSSSNGLAEKWGVSSDFKVQPIELTVALVSALSGESSDSQHPMELSVKELQQVADQLSHLDGFHPCYSQPTSACDGWRIPELGEWMLAAHAGQNTKFSGSDQLEDVSGAHQKVGQYAPNAWGIYDMTGSSLEWVSNEGGFGYTGDDMPLAQQKVQTVRRMDKRISGVSGRLVRSL